jgi:hypothetical protein
MFGRDPAERFLADSRRALAQRDRAIEEQQRQITRLHQQFNEISRSASMSDGYQEAYTRFREHEQRYANTILLLGYGGFFALWASAAARMPKMWFGVAGGFMVISLITFLSFELAKTFAGSLAISRVGSKEKDGRIITPKAALDLAEDWIGRVTKWWPLAFGIAVVTGFSAGAIVLWFFGVNAMADAHF